MKTLATLLHLVVWYGTALLVTGFFVTAVGMAAATAVRTVREGLRRLTWRRVGQGVGLLSLVLLAVLAIATSQNHGRVPAWLDPPPVSSLWSDGGRDAGATQVSDGGRP